MTDWKDALTTELLRDPGLRRPDPAEIYRRARVDALVERIEREGRILRVVGAAAGMVQWLTFDAVAALVTWSATASVILAAGAAVLTHASGVLLVAARAARA